MPTKKVRHPFYIHLNGIDSDEVPEWLKEEAVQGLTLEGVNMVLHEMKQEFGNFKTSVEELQTSVTNAALRQRVDHEANITRLDRLSTAIHALDLTVRLMKDCTEEDGAALCAMQEEHDAMKDQFGTMQKEHDAMKHDIMTLSQRQKL